MDEKENLKEMAANVKTLVDRTSISTIDDVLAYMKEQKAPAAKLEAPETKDDKAEMEQGALGGITKMEVFNVPVGQAVVGGFVAVFVTELIDSFMQKQSSVVTGLVKLVIAGVGAKWGKRLLGDTGAKAVTLLIAYDAIRDLIPFDDWAKTASSGITGAVSDRGLAQGRRRNPYNEGMRQFDKAANDYYALAEGR